MTRPTRRGTPTSPGRVILANLGAGLADALGQARLPLADVRGDRNVEMVATLPDDAREGRDDAFPATSALPPGTMQDRIRRLDAWPQIGPLETLSSLGGPSDASWNEVVKAACARLEDHWAAGVSCHH